MQYGVGETNCQWHLAEKRGRAAKPRARYIVPLQERCRASRHKPSGPPQTGGKPGATKEKRITRWRGCKREWRGLVWAAEREIHEFDTVTERVRNGGGHGIVQGAGACAAGEADFLQGLAAGSGAAHADEQPRPRSGRKARGIDCLRRDGGRPARLGLVSFPGPLPASARSGWNA